MHFAESISFKINLGIFSGHECDIQPYPAMNVIYFGILHHIMHCMYIKHAHVYTLQDPYYGPLAQQYHSDPLL